MLIFSHDKKNVVDARMLSVERNIGGGKDGKFMITASVGGFGPAVAATFPDEKSALDALEKAFRAFENGAVSYEF